jgi:hypothetical protein
MSPQTGCRGARPGCRGAPTGNKPTDSCPELRLSGISVAIVTARQSCASEAGVCSPEQVTESSCKREHPARSVARCGRLCTSSGGTLVTGCDQDHIDCNYDYGTLHCSNIVTGTTKFDQVRSTDRAPGPGRERTTQTKSWAGENSTPVRVIVTGRSCQISRARCSGTGEVRQG